MTSIIPKKLAIYYGWLSSVNATFSVSGAVSVFQVYDLLIVGAGLELPTHGDYANTLAIINNPGMANTQIFGYIDATQTLDVIQNQIDQWIAVGVKGIFLDKFGYDFGLTRDVQREIIWCVHAKNLLAFVNAWNPDDVFNPTAGPNNPNGLSTRLNPTDWYLAESFAIKLGAYDDSDLDGNGIKDFQDKAAKMTSYQTTYGIQLAATSSYDNEAFDQNKMDYSYFASALNGFNAFSFGEYLYSAVSAQLPFRTRRVFFGSRFTNSISNTSGIIEHQTNVGIHVDTNAHTVNILLN
jgi:hypothetical protein